MDVDNSRRPKQNKFSNLSKNQKSKKYQLSRAKVNANIPSHIPVQNESNVVNEVQNVMCEIPVPECVNVQHKQRVMANKNTSTSKLKSGCYVSATKLV